MQYTSIVALATMVAAVAAAPQPKANWPGYYPSSYYQRFYPSTIQNAEETEVIASPNIPYQHGYPAAFQKPYFMSAYERQQQNQNAEYADTDASSDNHNANENAIASDNLAGAKSENANENANLAKGGEAFGFGALESDNRNLLANENNIEVANANKNELGVEVANFNANENSAEQESAALAEVMNEDEAYFTDYQENESENLNFNDNQSSDRNGGRCRGGCGN
ncbi:hypothetical protein EDC01DRAFT_182137 [Geopyxis carbonaria]|nr:hypothetical protein EDC01DRAFT_182137 [Geopyxis carbonaria]